MIPTAFWNGRSGNDISCKFFCGILQPADVTRLFVVLLTYAGGAEELFDLGVYLPPQQPRGGWFQIPFS